MDNELRYVAVTDWHARHETYESRRLKGIGWFSVPTSDFSTVWNELAAETDGASIIGAWLGILHVAAGSKPRGILRKPDGTPHTARSLAAYTRFPESLVEKALSRLVALGLLTPDAPLAGVPAESAGVPAESAGDKPYTTPHHKPDTTNQTKPDREPETTRAPEQTGELKTTCAQNGDGHGLSLSKREKMDGDGMVASPGNLGLAAAAVERDLRKAVGVSPEGAESKLFFEKMELLKKAGVTGAKLNALAKRRDVTLARILKIVADVGRDQTVDNKPAVIVHRLEHPK